MQSNACQITLTSELVGSTFVGLKHMFAYLLLTLITDHIITEAKPMAWCGKMHFTSALADRVDAE